MSQACWVHSALALLCLNACGGSVTATPTGTGEASSGNGGQPFAISDGVAGAVSASSTGGTASGATAPSGGVPVAALDLCTPEQEAEYRAILTGEMTPTAARCAYAFISTSVDVSVQSANPDYRSVHWCDGSAGPLEHELAQRLSELGSLPT